MGFFSRMKSRFRREPEAPEVQPVDRTTEVVEAPKKRSAGGTQIFKIPIPGVGGVKREFVSPHVDFARIDQAYSAEAYVRRALDKHIELMFKAGWDIVGKNPKALEYVLTRLRSIAEVSNIPTQQLYVEIAEDLVKYSNALLVKSRKDDILPSGIKAVGVDGAKPVVAYFPFNVNWAEAEADTVGNIAKWQFNVPDASKPFKLRATDVIHFYYRREKGRVFATPFLTPALGDILALRQMEEAVLKLVYRNLYPLLHHTIGSEKDGYEGSDEEVLKAKDLIQSMDLESGLVTTERHHIKPIALNEIIDARDYLVYFERRLFTGLNTSETIMGRGATANRSTADNQADDLRDTVMAFQKVMEVFVNEFMFKELLTEGGFDPTLKPEDMVYFRFKEIDIDTKIKVENHAVYKYITNAITEDEMRDEIGRDAIEDAERERMFYNMVTIPVAAASGKTEGASLAQVANRTKPTNVAKPKKSAPPKEDRSSSPDEVFKLLTQELYTIADDYAQERTTPGGYPETVLIDLAVVLARTALALAECETTADTNQLPVSSLNAKILKALATAPNQATMHSGLEVLVSEAKGAYLGQAYET